MPTGQNHESGAAAADAHAKPVVLFDGACPLCTREIAFYRRRSGAESLDWVDLSHLEGHVSFCGIGLKAARARFHVAMPGGEAKSGAAAFIEIWRRLPAFRPLAWIFGNSAGIWLLDRAYDGFLRIRPRIQRLFKPR